MDPMDLTVVIKRPDTSVPWFQDVSTDNTDKYNALMQALSDYIDPTLGEVMSRTTSDLETTLTITWASWIRNQDYSDIILGKNPTLLQYQYEHLTYNEQHGITTTSSSTYMDFIKDLNLQLLKTWYNYPPD